MFLRSCMHAIIQSPRVWNENWNWNFWQPTISRQVLFRGISNTAWAAPWELYVWLFWRSFRVRVPAVSFHNFKSQIFKLSVSNPKSKYAAYLSVLSQISNCQGLGRKNKHETLKTDRSPGRGVVKPPIGHVGLAWGCEFSFICLELWGFGALLKFEVLWSIWGLVKVRVRLSGLWGRRAWPLPGCDQQASLPLGSRERRKQNPHWFLHLCKNAPVCLFFS